MKTSSLPSVRVEPGFRAEVEAVLVEGESLSEFVELSVRDGIARRRARAEFLRRGLASGEEARKSGEYVDAAVVLDRLEQKLEAARATVRSRLP